MSAARPAARGLRIAFVIDSIAAAAGTERQLARIVDRLARRGVDPVWVTLRGTAEGQRHDGVPVHRCPVDRILSPDAIEIRRLAAWLDRRDIDVVVTFFHDANIVGTLAGHLARRPVVGSRRNLGYWERRLDRLVLRWLRPLTAHWVANSCAARDRAVSDEGIEPSRVTVIHNGVDLERFAPASAARRARTRRALGLDDASLVLGCVANFRAIKGHAALLDAFGLARRRSKRSMYLVLIGDGPLREALERQARELGVNRAVRFIGPTDDVAELLGAVDIGLLASESESFPNAVQEYMAAGLASIATAVGGVPELIADGETGRLVEPRDVEAFARAIEELGASPDCRRRLGEAARADVSRRFGFATIVEQWRRELLRVAEAGAS